MAEGGPPLKDLTISQGDDDVGDWRSLKGLAEFESLCLEELPYKDRTTRTLYTVLRDEITGRALCMLHLLSNGHANLMNLKSSSNLLSVNMFYSFHKESAIRRYKNNSSTCIGFIRRRTLFYSDHRPILEGSLITSNGNQSLHLSEIGSPSVLWATIEPNTTKRYVVIKYIKKDISFTFKAAIIAFTIKHFKTFSLQYIQIERHPFRFDADMLFKSVYREDHTPGTSHAHQIGNSVTNLSSFDNITDLVVSEVAVSKFPRQYTQAVYALRDASDNTPLFMAYPSRLSAYTITNAVNTETIFFTEDKFSLGQKAGLYSWDNGTKYQIGSIQRYDIQCDAIDFPMTVNSNYFDEGYFAYIRNSKTDRIVAKNSTISDKNSAIIQVQKDVPTPAKLMIVAYALHRMHEHVSTFSLPRNPPDFNGDYQDLARKIFAKKDWPLIKLTPVPAPTITAKDPDVTSISTANKFRMEKVGYYSNFLNFYLMYNDQNRKVCHIIVNDRHYGNPRAMFRNAAAPQNITFACETRHELRFSTVIFNNEEIGVINNGERSCITRGEDENQKICYFRKVRRDDYGEAMSITIQKNIWARLVFDDQLSQVIAEFFGDMDIYWRILIIAFGMKMALKKNYYQKQSRYFSGTAEILQLVQRINKQ